MFTGIVEEVGTIRANGPRGGGHSVHIECSRILDGLEPGSSIAVNGACVTATAVSSGGFSADLSPETLARSTLGGLSPGTPVNLERSLRLGDRVEGHLLTGHIDGTGTVRAMRRTGEYLEIDYAAPGDILRYVVEKGSVAVDGISLTVAGVSEDSFRVAVVPESVRRTNISRGRSGDRVNLECDIIGKYVERFLRAPGGPREGITLGQLREHGYA